MDDYQFRECLSKACFLRYPIVEETPQAMLCPRCHQNTRKIPVPKPERAPVHSQLSDSPALQVLVDNVRSLHNVGAIFRSADGVGVQHIYLCGISPSPENKKLQKTALGSQESVSWSYATNGLKLARQLIAEGFCLWALEDQPGAVSLFESNLPLPKEPLVLVVGHERIGIDPEILALCQKIVHLPMLGLKDSLNVAVAFGAAVYQLRLGLGSSVTLDD